MTIIDRCGSLVRASGTTMGGGSGVASRAGAGRLACVVLACALLALCVAGCVGGAELERVERAVDQLARESRGQEERLRRLARESQSSAEQAVTIEADRAGDRADALERAGAELARLREAHGPGEAWHAIESLGTWAAGGVWGLGGMLVGAGAWGLARGWAVRRGLERVGRALEEAAAREPAVADTLRRHRADLSLIRSAGVRRMLDEPGRAE
jgi:outer membrane murein-binding lipoprotein Lpp